MKNGLLIILVFLACPALSQLPEDSTEVVVYDSGIGDTSLYYSDQIDSTNGYEHVQYTQTPGELSVTREELQKRYKSKKFSKTEWKRIVGNTNYSEEAVKAKKLPNLAWDPHILKVIGYIVIFGLIGFLIFLFVKQALKDSDAKTRKAGEALFADQLSPEALEEIDLEKLLQEALAQKNLRLAVRLFYIKLLKHLNRQGYIRWEKNKTNRDYADELSRAGFSRDFRKLMVAYEYVWYGNRTPSAEEFSALESNFNTLYKTERA